MSSYFVPGIVRAVASLVLAFVSAGAATASAAERYWPPIVDPATHQYTPGRWVWADLVTADVAAAADFYGKVFGWTFETYGGADDHDTYTLVLANGLPIGGMVFDARAMRDKTPTARWIGFVSVTDAAATSAAVAKQGGQVVFAPAPLGERGETGVFRDPEGTLFGAIHSRNGDPGDYLGDVGEWCWLDLWTSNVEQAKKFYTAVLGYEALPGGEGTSARQRVHLVASGHVRAGIIEKLDTKAGSTWLPYVRVADAAAVTRAANAAGGRILYEPMKVGAGLVAIVADPTGAPVGVVQFDSPEAQR
jgi:predicted enzyme related to lactoylglutathione lyase